MKDYNNLSDEDLSVLAQNGDKEGSEFLLRRYKNLVIKCTRPFFIIGQEQDDLIQEGMIGLYKAILSYKSSGAKFITYATKCVKSSIIDALKSSTRNKHMPLNNYSTLISAEGKEEHRHLLIEDSPEEIAESLESDSQLLLAIKSQLSDKEMQVYSKFLAGSKISEISVELNMTYKSVDNALQRIRKKIKDILMKNN